MLNYDEELKVVLKLIVSVRSSRREPLELLTPLRAGAGARVLLSKVL